MIYYVDEIWDIDGVPFATKRSKSTPKAPTALDGLYHQIFKEATDAFVKGDYALSEQMSQQAIAIDPKPEAYNNLAMAQYDQDKFEEAAANYYKAVALGLKPDPDSEKAMRPYKYREFEVKSPYGPSIPFKGRTNCSDLIIHNVLRAILAKLDDPRDIILIRPEFTQFLENGKDFKEEWFVNSKNGTRSFYISLYPTTEGNADYDIMANLNDINVSGSIFIDGRQWDLDKYDEGKSTLSITFSPQGGGDEELIYGIQNFPPETIMYEKSLMGNWSSSIWQSLYPECFEQSVRGTMTTEQLGLSGGQLQIADSWTTTDQQGVTDEQHRVSGILTMKSNVLENVIKDAMPKYIINDFQCPARPHEYQIARFETDTDTGSMLMLMYRVNKPMSLEIKDKWTQDLDLYELKDNLDLKLILQKIKDQHAQ